MNVTASGYAYNKPLPSLDWIAFGVAFACAALGTVVHQLNILVPVALFLPSLLRELGLVHDKDEFTQQIMHRAGFHALLVTALVVFSVWAFARQFTEQFSIDLLTGETLRKVIMYTFVVSYLLQYWGSREGSFRILLGMALWSLTPLVAMLKHPEMFAHGFGGSVLVVAMALAQVGLAFVVRYWPRLGGVLLVAAWVVSVGSAMGMLGEGVLTFAVPSLVLQASILPGAMGLALLLAWRRGEG